MAAFNDNRYTAATDYKVWNDWIVSDNTTTGSSLYTAWNNAITSTTATTAHDVYVHWAHVRWREQARLDHGQMQAQQQMQMQNQAPYGWVKRSDNEVRERLRAQRLRAHAERQAREDEAKLRAHELLFDHLDEEQKHDMLTKGGFFLLTKSGRRYRIDRGTHGNVKLVDEKGKPLAQYCAQPNGVPQGDANLAQKLMLETDEDAFLRVANCTRFG